MKKLIEKHYAEEAPHIRGRLRKMGIRTPEEAEDLAHDVYERALKATNI